MVLFDPKHNMQACRKFNTFQFGKKYSNISNVVSSELSINYKKISWIKIFYGTTGNIYWQQNYREDFSNLKTVFNKLKIFVFPAKHLSILWFIENSFAEIAKNKYEKNTFFDFTAEYKLSDRAELSVDINNIFNVEQYSRLSVTGPNINYYTLPLRGREYLLSLKLKL